MKPRVIRISDSEETFDWISDGWNTVAHPNPNLFTKVRKHIRAGKDIADVIKRLEEAGFEVVQLVA